MRILGVAAVVALLLAGCGSDDETAAPRTVTVTETLTETEVTTIDEPAFDCAVGGVTLPEQDLPPAVAEVRRRVFEAAIDCDFEELERIALEKGEGFTFSYGGGTSAADYWRRVEEAAQEQPSPMLALATILTMPFTRNEAGSYAWPTAYDENPTEAAWQALVDAGLYSAETVETMKTQGFGYLGYRTAITPDGDWQFFVAGD